MSGIITIDELESRLRDNPKSLLFAHLADLYLLDSRIDDALHILSLGIKEHPAYVTGHFIRAKAQLAKGDAEQAENSLKTVLMHDRQFLSAHKMLGDIMAKEGWENKAVIHYKDLLHIDPLDPEARQMLDGMTDQNENFGEYASHEFISEDLEPEIPYIFKTEDNWQEEFNTKSINEKEATPELETLTEADVLEAMSSSPSAHDNAPDTDKWTSDDILSKDSNELSLIDEQESAKVIPPIFTTLPADKKTLDIATFEETDSKPEPEHEHDFDLTSIVIDDKDGELTFDEALESQITETTDIETPEGVSTPELEPELENDIDSILNTMEWPDGNTPEIVSEMANENIEAVPELEPKVTADKPMAEEKIDDDSTFAIATSEATDSQSEPEHDFDLASIVIDGKDGELTFDEALELQITETTDIETPEDVSTPELEPELENDIDSILNAMDGPGDDAPEIVTEVTAETVETDAELTADENEPIVDSEDKSGQDSNKDEIQPENDIDAILSAMDWPNGAVPEVASDTPATPINTTDNIPATTKSISSDEESIKDHEDHIPAKSIEKKPPLFQESDFELDTVDEAPKFTPLFSEGSTEEIEPDKKGSDALFENVDETGSPEEHSDFENSDDEATIVSPTLGEIYTAQGQWAKAITIYERLLEKDPEKDAYKQKIQELTKKIDEE
ncbi:hypothetical protein KAR48_19905 [bacterium]|nr:hypothetical protein [bacterium]